MLQTACAAAAPRRGVLHSRSTAFYADQIGRWRCLHSGGAHDLAGFGFLDGRVGCLSVCHVAGVEAALKLVFHSEVIRIGFAKLRPHSNKI